MRRVGSVVIGAAALIVAFAPGARAEDPSSAPRTGAVSACTINDERATHLVGVAATDTGYVVVNRVGADVAGDSRVLLLDKACKVTSTTTYSSRPAGPQDVAVDKDGTIWVADVGDPTTGTRRKTIAVWKVGASGGRLTGTTIYRMQYPDGPHDAAAMLIGGDGLPVVVTKEARGAAGIYKPTGALQPGSAAGAPLQRVGGFTPGKQGTRNKLGAVGWNMVTGGAIAPGGRRAVLRTYSDAYEFDVTGGDVAAAITTGKPRVTPLPDEPFGEAISYTRDGASFVTVSDVDGAVALLVYRPAAAAATPVKSAAPVVQASSSSWWRPTSVQQVLYLIGGVGALGVVLVVIGVFGIVRSRSRRRVVDRAEKASRSENRGVVVGEAAGQRPGVYATASVPGAATAPARVDGAVRRRTEGATYGRGGVYGRAADAGRTGAPRPPSGTGTGDSGPRSASDRS